MEHKTFEANYQNTGTTNKQTKGKQNKLENSKKKRKHCLTWNIKLFHTNVEQRKQKTRTKQNEIKLFLSKVK